MIETAFAVTVDEHTESLAESSQAFEATTWQYHRAFRRALNKTARWLQSQSIKQVSREKKLPQKLLRHRISVSQARHQSMHLTAYLVANLRGVRGCDVGVQRQTALGARAGRFLFPRSFIATMPHGHRGIYRRRTAQALPIQEVRVPLGAKAAAIIVALVKEQTMPQFQRYFAHELAFATRFEAAGGRH